MKISYLFRSFGRTGGPIVHYNFMDNLVQRGHEVYAVTPKKNMRWEAGMWKTFLDRTQKSSHLTKTIERKIIGCVLKKCFKNTYQKTYKPLQAIQSLKKMTAGLVSNWVPSDVTISTFILTSYASYFLSSKTVSIVHMQHLEEIFFDDPTWRFLARNTYFLPLMRIANSTWLINILNKFYQMDSYLLTPGIDLTTFKCHKDPKEKYHSKHEWTIASFVDEKREWKGFKDAVQAVKIARKHLAAAGISIQWKIYGLEAPKKRYDTDFQYAGRIYGSDLSEFYSSADIVLVPSWYESFPMPPIEAMACGTLVITTRYGTEDYAIDGTNSLVCQPRNIQEMADKIIMAIKKPQESLKFVDSALENVREYSWKRRVDTLENIMDDALIRYPKNRNKLYDTLITDLIAGRFEPYMAEIFRETDEKATFNRGHKF